MPNERLSPEAMGIVQHDSRPLDGIDLGAR